MPRRGPRHILQPRFIIHHPHRPFPMHHPRRSIHPAPHLPRRRIRLQVQAPGDRARANEFRARVNPVHAFGILNAAAPLHRASTETISSHSPRSPGAPTPSVGAADPDTPAPSHPAADRENNFPTRDKLRTARASIRTSTLFQNFVKPLLPRLPVHAFPLRPLRGPITNQKPRQTQPPQAQHPEHHRQQRKEWVRVHKWEKRETRAGHE